jgi:hypothetical protein
MEQHVFLSYSRKDTDIMQRVRDDLRSSGLTVWTDEGIEPGTPLWKDSIESAIESTGCLVVILSPSAKKSIWVKRELEYAEVQEKRAFPLLARGNIKDSIPFALIGMQFVDITNDYNELNRLIVAVANFLQVSISLSPASDRTNLEEEEEEQPGFLDLAVDGQEALREVNYYTLRMAELTEDLQKNIVTRTEELSDALDNTKMQHNVIKSASFDLTLYGKEIQKLIPEYRRLWGIFGDNITGLISYANLSNEEEREALIKFKTDVQKLQNSLSYAQAGVGKFLASISNLPGITKDLKRGKRQAENAIANLIEELAAGDIVLARILNSIDRLL